MGSFRATGSRFYLPFVAESNPMNIGLCFHCSLPVGLNVVSRFYLEISLGLEAANWSSGYVISESSTLRQWGCTSLLPWDTDGGSNRGQYTGKKNISSFLCPHPSRSSCVYYLLILTQMSCFSNCCLKPGTVVHAFITSQMPLGQELLEGPSTWEAEASDSRLVSVSDEVLVSSGLAWATE